MPLVKIPISGIAYKNVDPVALTSQSEVLTDGYVDESKSTNRRPGLELFTTLPTINDPINGLFWWEKKGVVIAVSNGIIYSIDQNGNQDVILGATLETTGKVIFAVHRNSLIMANGGSMVITGGTTANTITGVGAPNNVTHVAFIDEYILGNYAGTGRFAFSGVGTPEDWDTDYPAGDNYATAELRPDNINAIHTTAWGEIHVFGEESLEVWYNDGSAPFIPFKGAGTTRGCIAPHTIVQAANTYFYLDHAKRIIKLEDRKAVLVSGPFNKAIQNLTTVDDAYAILLEIEGRSFYVISFPTEKLTYAYDIDLTSWSQWGYWNKTTSKHDHWLVNSYCNPNTWGFALVGDRRNTGKIYKISSDYNDDAGDTIRFFRRTGHINHGTHKKKRSNRLTIRLRRGVGKSDGTEPYITIRWRNDNKNLWSNEKFVKLNKAGNTEFIARLYRLGMYRTRQYEITMTDAVPLVLVEAEEDVDIMNS